MYLPARYWCQFIIQGICTVLYEAPFLSGYLSLIFLICLMTCIIFVQGLDSWRERVATQLAAAGDQPDLGDCPAPTLPPPRLGTGQETELFSVYPPRSHASPSLHGYYLLLFALQNIYCCAAPMVCFFLSTTAQLHATHRKGGRRRKRHSTSTREWGHSCIARGYCVS